MTGIGMAFFPANFLLQRTTHEDDPHHPPTSLTPTLTSCTSQDFHGVGSLIGKRSMSFSCIDVFDHQETNTIGDHDELYSDDDGSQQLGGGGAGGEKKRRLNMEQVRTLEKSFELGNKLEPERKLQLARALGLHPRQVAIWFQNRRARWKNKQLEKDFIALKRQFEAIKAHNDALQSHNKKLQAEILSLKNRDPTESINLNKETEGSSSGNRSGNSSENIQLDISRTPPIDSPLSTHPTSRPHFPPPIRPTGVAHLFQSRTDPLFHGKINDQAVKLEESFCNIFPGVEDQTGFWPWLEHQPFN